MIRFSWRFIGFFCEVYSIKITPQMSVLCDATSRIKQKKLIFNSSWSLSQIKNLIRVLIICNEVFVFHSRRDYKLEIWTFGNLFVLSAKSWLIRTYSNAPDYFLLSHVIQFKRRHEFASVEYAFFVIINYWLLRCRGHQNVKNVITLEEVIIWFFSLSL